MIKVVGIIALVFLCSAAIAALGKLFSSGKAKSPQEGGCCGSNRLAIQSDEEKPSGGCGSGKCCR
jgi:hypothetical protein